MVSDINDLVFTQEPEPEKPPVKEEFAINKYRHCHTEWEDLLSAASMPDQCPVCGAMVTPYQWEELV